MLAEDKEGRDIDITPDDELECPECKNRDRRTLDVTPPEFECGRLLWGGHVDCLACGHRWAF